MKMYKILTLMSLSLIGVIMLGKAQLAPKNNKEIPGVLKLDTPWNLHNFAVKPRYSTTYGGPVEIPNAYKPSDTIKLKKHDIKVYPLPRSY